jgi:hypothetical protein
MTKINESLVCGTQVYEDQSGGQGHCWRAVSAANLPANIVAEIEAEIIDGGREQCDDYVASNGMHYRW